MLNEHAVNIESNERILLYDLWKLLHGEEKQEVTLDDCKVVIMSVLRMHNPKRILDVEYEEGMEVGFYNEQGKFCLRIEEIPRLQKYFNLLFLNRLQFIGKVIEQKNIQKQQ